MGQRHDYDENEIDLRSFGGFLRRRKKPILGSSCLAVIIAIIVVAITNRYTPDPYVATSTIKLGMLHFEVLNPVKSTQSYVAEQEISGHLISPERMIEIEGRLALPATLAELQQRIAVGLEKRNGESFLSISARGASEQEAEDLCRELSGSAVHYIEESLSERLWAVREELLRLGEKSGRLRRGIEETEDLLSRLGESASTGTPTNQDEVHIGLLKMTFYAAKNDLADTESRALRYKRLLQLAKPEEIQPPRVSKSHKRLRWIPTIITLGLLGLVFGISLGFLKERKQREGERREKLSSGINN